MGLTPNNVLTIRTSRIKVPGIDFVLNILPVIWRKFKKTRGIKLTPSRASRIEKITRGKFEGWRIEDFKIIDEAVYQCAVVPSVVVTADDFESGLPGSNPEWGLIYYKASITAQGLPKPSSLRGSTLGTRAAEHKGCNWACKLTDGCSLKSCARPHLLAYATEIKSTQLHSAPLWLG